MRRFLLISDIHACSVDPTSSGAPSYVSNVTGPGTSDPISDLSRLIKDEKIAVDAILCPGDITNKSEPAPLAHTWSRLHELARDLSVDLIATVGNHDVDSRYNENKFDPRGYIRALVPSIPVANRSNFLEYWAENFTIISRDDCTVVVLNTTAYHGGAKDVLAEIEHGRVSELTLASLSRAIGLTPKTSVNIVLCHHHPLKGESEDLDTSGVTRGGERLVELLGSSDRSWIVVHGHKHVPDLFYGHGGANAPVILACASFSAQVNADAKNKNPNQVHLLECAPEEAKANGLSSAGKVRSWTWQPGTGWRRSQGPHGLPHDVGFGYRGSIDSIVDQLETYLQGEDGARASWAKAVAAVPVLVRLVPSDYDTLGDVMSKRNLRLLHDRDGTIAEVGRAP